MVERHQYHTWHKSFVIICIPGKRISFDGQFHIPDIYQIYTRSALNAFVPQWPASVLACWFILHRMTPTEECKSHHLTYSKLTTHLCNNCRALEYSHNLNQIICTNWPFCCLYSESARITVIITRDERSQPSPWSQTAPRPDQQMLARMQV
jgi:hypothetical protein